MSEIDNGDRRQVGRRLDNCAENSHSGASPRSRPPGPSRRRFRIQTPRLTQFRRDRLSRPPRETPGVSGPAHRIPEDFAVSRCWELVCLSAFSAPQADAEVVIDGGRDEMQVRVENDTVGHVLEALGRNGNLHNRSATPLNKVIDGSFSGSLGQVLFRILDGYDFVIRHDPEGVEVFVFGESGAAPIRTSPPTEPTPEQTSPRPHHSGGRPGG